jgi:cell division septation protein DedD
MADAPKNPPRGDENKPAPGANFSPLDLDVRSSAGPYPRPRRGRGKLKKTWLAVAGAAVILGLPWFLFSSDEEAAPPATAPPAPVASLTGSVAADREETLDFAPVPDQPEDKRELAEDTPAQATPAQPAVSAEPEAKPAPPAAPVKPAEAKPKEPPVKPAEPVRAAPPVEPVQAVPVQVAPVQVAPAQVAPVQAAEQPAPAVEKAGEISDKWVVNVSSTPDSAESLRFLSTLLGQDVGGRVYASEAVLEGRIQHRIRVGFFDTREEAEAVGLKIKERFRLYATPWAVRPSKEEENKYGDGR